MAECDGTLSFVEIIKSVIEVKYPDIVTKHAEVMGTQAASDASALAAAQAALDAEVALSAMVTMVVVTGAPGSLVVWDAATGVLTVPVGLTGAVGATGATGAQGLTGAVGATGATGAQGLTGAVGAAGNGIVDVVRTAGTGAAGTIDTYTVSYTDGSSSVFSVYNGADGATGAQGLTGAVGAAGNGIVDVVRTAGTGAAGTVDTYTISYTDGSSSVFSVYNGADGAGVGDMLKTVYDSNNSGSVDNAEKVNNLTVGTAVPVGAVFTDTVYDDTALQTAVDLNTAKVSNVDHPLVGTAVPVGAVFTDTVYDDTALQTALLGKASLDGATFTGALRYTNRTFTSAIDCALGNWFEKTVTANFTQTFLNVPASGVPYVAILILVNAGAYVITWDAAIKWGGTAPTFSAVGVDVVKLFTIDGGLSWNASVSLGYV